MNAKPEPSKRLQRFIEYRTELLAINTELRNGAFQSWADAVLLPNHPERYIEPFVTAHRYFDAQAKLANRAAVLADVMQAMVADCILPELATFEYELSLWQSENRK
jgi:hypothetical protein